MSQETITSENLYKIYKDLMRAHAELDKRIAAEYKKPKEDRAAQEELDARTSEANKILQGASYAYNLYVTNALSNIKGSAETINKGIKEAADVIKKLKIADQTIKVISKLIEITVVLGTAVGNWKNLGKLPDLIKDLADLVKEAREAEPA
ncbi:hypothetical protein ACIP01_06960 [Pseudomonas monteilii]|uniref:hypothetical protein n=1 Tax=Pseudomonas monteilii TaxID=76759 RepID=UPI00381F2B8A